MIYLFLLLTEQPQTAVQPPQVSIASEAMVENISSSVGACLHDHSCIMMYYAPGEDWREEGSQALLISVHPPLSQFSGPGEFLGQAGADLALF